MDCAPLPILLTRSPISFQQVREAGEIAWLFHAGPDVVTPKSFPDANSARRTCWLEALDVATVDWGFLRLQVRNRADVPLPFKWVQFVPPPELPDTSGLPGAAHAQRRTNVKPRPTNDKTQAFFVRPETGTLAASTETEFVVEFRPRAVDSYQRLLRLMVDVQVRAARLAHEHARGETPPAKCDQAHGRAPF